MKHTLILLVIIGRACPIADLAQAIVLAEWLVRDILKRVWQLAWSPALFIELHSRFLEARKLSRGINGFAHFSLVTSGPLLNYFMQL